MVTKLELLLAMRRRIYRANHSIPYLCHALIDVAKIRGCTCDVTIADALSDFRHAVIHTGGWRTIALPPEVASWAALEDPTVISPEVIHCHTAMRLGVLDALIAKEEAKQCQS